MEVIFRFCKYVSALDVISLLDVSPSYLEGLK